MFAPDQEPTTAPETIQYGRGDIERGQVRTSLLREHLEASPSENAIEDDGSYQAGASDEPLLQRDGSVDFRDRERKALGNELGRSFSASSGARSNSIFAIPPHLATPPIIGSYGSYRSYGTIDSDVSRESMAHAGALWRQQQEAGANVPDGEVEPILVKEVEQDGKIVLAVEGQSTLPQTIFNSTKYALLAWSTMATSS